MQHTFPNLLSQAKTTAPKGHSSKQTRPTYNFVFSNNWKFSRSIDRPISLAAEFGELPFDLNLAALTDHARRPLTRLEADLIWLAMSVYLSDRFALRNPFGQKGLSFWRRKICVEIPVAYPNVWANAKDLLTNALEFLTEDDWSFEFVDGRSEFEAEVQQYFPVESRQDFNWTALFSGGLDSMAGSLQWLNRSEGAGLLVSGQTHNRIAVEQSEQAAELRSLFPGKVEHVGIKYGIPDKMGVKGTEVTQRTRAFIHIALGAVAALRSGCNGLMLFENGFGALNLPCDRAQFGSQNSRGTHPVFLKRMGELIAVAFDRDFQVCNPFLPMTKAHMLPDSGSKPIVRLLQKTFSCDRFPNYPRKASQCGRCPSCLIRRLSLFAAGLPDACASYSTNVLNSERRIGNIELESLSKLTTQADVLARSLGSRDPWGALCQRWPDLLLTERELEDATFRGKTISLLRDHVEEWRSFSRETCRESSALAA